jgi:quercetin dioxygenase-like cupin family protein
MEADDITGQLRAEGFTEVYTWHNAPGDIYPTHVHPDVTAHVVLQGMLILEIDGEEHEYREMERFDIPACVQHSARFGPAGCTYIIGEKV